jgi:monofunctional glycosyltransferase
MDTTYVARQRRRILALGLILLTAAALIICWVWSSVLKGLPSGLLLGDNQAIQQKLGLKSWLALSAVPTPVWQAIVICEDDMFFRHHGLRLSQTITLAGDDLVHNHRLRGGSTITQQVAKNVFLSPERSLNRKLKEAILARRLERKFGKKRILEVYLNVAEWGPDLRGLEAASQSYFGRPVSDLKAKEGAFLAALLPNPIARQAVIDDPEVPRWMRRKINRTLDGMWQTGKLSTEVFQAEMERPLVFKDKKLTWEFVETPRPVSATVKSSSDEPAR